MWERGERAQIMSLDNDGRYIFYGKKYRYFLDPFLFKEVDGPYPTPKEPMFFSGNYYYSEKDSLIVLCDIRNPSDGISFSGILIYDPKKLFSVGENRNDWAKLCFKPARVDFNIKVLD